MDKSRKEVKVRGTQWLEVAVDPLAVLEAERAKYLSRADWIAAANGKYYIMYEDQLGEDVEKEEISFELYDYLTNLRLIITSLLKLRLKESA